MNAFIATCSNEIVSTTHLQIRITLLMNWFIGSDKRVLCWRQALLTRMHFMLEMNTLVLERNVLQTRVRASATRTHSQLSLHKTKPWSHAEPIHVHVLSSRGKVSEKSYFQVRGGPVKGTETRQGWKNQVYMYHPTMDWWRPPLWPPTQCNCIPSYM